MINKIKIIIIFFIPLELIGVYNDKLSILIKALKHPNIRRS